MSINRTQPPPPCLFSLFLLSPSLPMLYRDVLPWAAAEAARAASRAMTSAAMLTEETVCAKHMYRFREMWGRSRDAGCRLGGRTSRARASSACWERRRIGQRSGSHCLTLAGPSSVRSKAAVDRVRRCPHTSPPARPLRVPRATMNFKVRTYTHRHATKVVVEQAAHMQQHAAHAQRTQDGCRINPNAFLFLSY